MKTLEPSELPPKQQPTPSDRLRREIREKSVHASEKEICVYTEGGKANSERGRINREKARERGDEMR